MEDLQTTPAQSNGKRFLQFAALFLLLIVLPLGTVYYTNGGNDSFKEMIGELHEYGEIPDFQFATHNGETLTKEDLKGKLIVNTFFSLKDDEKDLLTTQLKKLHDVFNDKDEVLFLMHSLSSDSGELDQLKDYAEKAGLTDEEQFFLLVGDQQSVVNYLTSTFKWPSNFESREKNVELEFGKMPNELTTYPYIVVADKQSMIRNYYDYKDNIAMGRLVEHLALLLPSRVDDDPVLMREKEK